ncbi:MAG TPA: integrase [Desulfobacterales bacterium]|nr:integrase [Desulfobacterales bacterium]
MQITNRAFRYSSALADVIQGFVLEKQALGYKYEKTAFNLKRFDDFCISVGHNSVCLPKKLVLQWTEKKPFESESNHNGRVMLMRMLAKYLVRLGHDAYIYPDRTGSAIHENYHPYLFSEIELALFFTQVDQCPPSMSSPNRHIILPLLFRILYCCGLRISEAVQLRDRDVNTAEGTLTILDAKFGKDRLVPMSSSLCSKCQTYREVMHRISKPDYFFFPSPHGGHYKESTIYQYFRKFLWQAGISHGGRGKGPRLHDFRHTFAVNCLKRWVRAGVDLSAALPYLSIYLGHTGLENTQHYLRLTAELYPEIVATIDEKFGWLLPEEDHL